jgi:hypothetical protein
MSNCLFGLGRNNFLTKQLNWTGDTNKATLLSMSTQAGKIYLVTGATNASPIVVSLSSTTGISNGDIVVIGGVGGNTAANGTWQVSSVVTNTSITLITRLDGVNSTGNGSWTSGGWIIDVSSASTLTDVSGNTIGTDVSLSGETATLGVANASAWTWTGLTATKAWAVAVYDNTASGDLIAFYDGTYQVYVITQASASATSIAVARLSVAIPNASTLVFSDGSSATLTAQANIGDTSLTVSSLAATVHRQATADVTTLNAGLPVTPAPGGSLQFTPDSGVNKLFAL